MTSFQTLPSLSWIATHFCHTLQEECQHSSLLHHYTTHWQETLVDTSIAICIIGVATAVFLGSTFFGLTFSILLASSCVSSFYVNRISSFSLLQQTIQEFQRSRADLEANIAQLSDENATLHHHCQELSTTNQQLQTTHAALDGTNTDLTRQVTILTLQLHGLQTASEAFTHLIRHVHYDAEHLSHTRGGFERQLNDLEAQLSNARLLSHEIGQLLNAQQSGLHEQLNQLREHLAQLTQDTHFERARRELNALQRAVREQTQELDRVQLQFAQEHGRLETIRLAFEHVRSALSTEVERAGSTHRRLEGVATQISSLIHHSTLVQE